MPDEKTCIWSPDDDYCGVYATSCGNLFLFTTAGPLEMGFTHCPYCGGRLRVTEFVDDDDAEGDDA